MAEEKIVYFDKARVQDIIAGLEQAAKDGDVDPNEMIMLALSCVSAMIASNCPWSPQLNTWKGREQAVELAVTCFRDWLRSDFAKRAKREALSDDDAPSSASS